MTSCHVTNLSRDSVKMARGRKKDQGAKGQKKEEKHASDDKEEQMDVETFYGKDTDTGGRVGEGDKRARTSKSQGGRDDSGPRGTTPPPERASSSGMKGKFPSKQRELSDVRKSRKESTRYVHYTHL